MNSDVAESIGSRFELPREEIPGAAAGWDRPGGRRLFGLRVSAIVEIALFFSVAFLLDLTVLSADRFWDVTPHPCWVVVLLLTAQYGTNEGLLASLASSLFLLVGNLPEQELSQDIYQYGYQLVRRPLFWFAAAVLWGELRMRQVRERNQLRRDLSSSRQREDTIAKEYERTRQLKKDLELRLAGQMNTALTLFQSARSIEKLERDEVLLGVNEIVLKLLNPVKFSVYLLEDDRLRVSIRHGWKGEEGYAREFSSRSLLFQKIVAERRILCGSHPDDEAVLSEEGVLAGALIDNGSKQIHGMLKVESLGFLDFNLSSVHTFKVLCEWIGTTYHNALRYEAARRAGVVNEETRLFSYGFFARQKDFLVGVAKRIGFHLSVVVIRLENRESLSVAEARKIPRLVGEAAVAVLRETDMAFDYERTGYEFAIVLPGTPDQNAPLVADKVARRLEDLLKRKSIRARFSYVSQSLHREKHDSAMLSRHIYLSRLEFLDKLTRRMAFKRSILAFSVTNLEGLPREHRLQADNILRAAFAAFLKRNEGIFAYQRSVCRIEMVLPGVSARQSLRVGDFLRTQTEPLLGKFKTRLIYSVQSDPARVGGEVDHARSA